MIILQQSHTAVPAVFLYILFIKYLHTMTHTSLHVFDSICLLDQPTTEIFIVNENRVTG